MRLHAEASKPEEIEDFIAESAIMLDFNHPNVLRLVGVCFDTENKLPLIVLPYMANGDLRSYLKSKRSKTSSSSDEIMPEVQQLLALSTLPHSHIYLWGFDVHINICVLIAGSLRSCVAGYVYRHCLRYGLPGKV
jgi:serine/threonine protein kinase